MSLINSIFGECKKSYIKIKPPHGSNKWCMTRNSFKLVNTTSVDKVFLTMTIIGFK